MNKAHSNINWENYPSSNTPLNEQNLNKMDNSIDEIDNRVIILDTTKANKTEVAKLIKDISFDENTGVFTITKKDGSVFTIDTKMEKIAINFSYDTELQQIILTLIDGTIERIDLSDFVTQYEFLDTDTISFSTDMGGNVSAIVKEGSIEEKHLQPNYLAEIKIESEKAQTASANATKSEINAKSSETIAKASEANARQSELAAVNSSNIASEKASEAATSAINAANSSDNATQKANAANVSATNAANSATTAMQKATIANTSATNAENYSKQAQSYAIGTGNVRPSESTDNAKYYYEQSKNIYDNFSNSGNVTGVKGNAETSYRTGNVNLTPENIGAVAKSGDTMTGTLNSSLLTATVLEGNKGKVIVNSNANANNYVMLDKLNSTHGYFTDGVYQNRRIFNYTSKDIVDSNTNNFTYQLTLLDENGNSTFPALISASRGSFKGDIIVTANRSDTLNPTIPCSGRMDEGINSVQDLSEYKTFLGSYCDIDRIWWNVVSVRHGNGWNDGHYLGMYIRSKLLENGDLLWGKQIGSAKGWQDERILLDSYNYKKYCLPLSGGSMNQDATLNFTGSGVINTGITMNADDSNVTITPAYLEAYRTLYDEDGNNPYNYRKITTITPSKIELVNVEPDDSYDRIIIENDYIKIIDHEWSEEFTINSDGIKSDSDLYIRVDNGENYYVFDSDNFRPVSNVNNAFDLGLITAKWRNIYAQNGIIQTSDRTKKTNINRFNINQVKAFINGLNPVSYKMIDGTSGRTHYGFIAQDIEELMNTLNMDSSDFAGFIKSPKKTIKYEDENGKKLENPIEEVLEGEYDYALRYDEFIAPLTKVVQEQQREIEELKEDIKFLKEYIYVR